MEPNGQCRGCVVSQDEVSNGTEAPSKRKGEQIGKRTRAAQLESGDALLSTSQRLRAHKWADDGGGAEGWIFPRLPG